MTPRAPILPLVLTALLALPRGAAGDDPPAGGAGTDVETPPGLSAEEEAAGRAALRAVVVLATAPEGSLPPEGDAQACGFRVGGGGVVVTTWRFLARAAAAPGGARVWARALGGAWEPAVPLGRVSWADLGVLRLAPSPREADALAWGASPRAFGPRLLGAGPGKGGGGAIRAGVLSTIEWFEPAVAGGRVVARRSGASRGPDRGAEPTSLRLHESLAGRAVDGTPLVDATGACVGMVVRVDADRPAHEAVLARPAGLLRPATDAIDAEGRFDPLDLGLRLEPGGGSASSPDLERLRATTKEKGGAAVVWVHPEGPSLGILWPGDLVLAVEGRPVFAEVVESLPLACLGLRDGTPADVTVWRGGRRATLRVTPVRAHGLYRDVLGEMESRGAAPR